MIDNLKDAISHAREVAEKQRIRFEDIYAQEEQTAAERKEAIACLDCSNEHGQLVAWLTELQERREADKWRPTTEPPKDETDVLVCNGKGDMIVCRGSRSTEIKDKFIWYLCDWRYGEIIAWKPLPKAPESEVESD